jgi:hypothetical protein
MSWILNLFIPRYQLIPLRKNKKIQKKIEPGFTGYFGVVRQAKLGTFLQGAESLPGKGLTTHTYRVLPDWEG